MAHKKASAKRKVQAHAHGKKHTRKWQLPHLVVAAGILVALVASVPVGTYLKAQLLSYEMMDGSSGGYVAPYVAPVVQPAPYVAPVVEPAPYVAPVVQPAPYVAPVVEPAPYVAPVVQPATMPVCAPGQQPTAANPCMMQGYQPNQPPTGTTGGDCWNSSSPAFATPECTQMRANQNNAGMQPPQNMPVCAPGQQPTAAAPCLIQGNQQGSSCGAGTVWCPAVAGSNLPAGCYATCPTAGTNTNIQNMPVCAPGQQPTAANPCKLENHQGNQTGAQTGGDCWNSQSPAFATQTCTAQRAAVNDAKVNQPGMQGETVMCPALGGKQASPEECAKATPVCPPGTQPSMANPCRMESGYYPYEGGDNAPIPQPFYPSQSGQEVKGKFFMPQPMPFPFFNNNQGGMGPGMGPGPGMEPGMNGKFMPPSFDQGCPPGDPFCQAYGEGGFDQFKFEFDFQQPMNPEDFRQFEDGKAAQRHLKDVQRMVKQFENDYKMRSKEIERVSRRSGGLACPPLVQAQSIMEAWAGLLEEAGNVTVDNLGEIEQKLQYVHGGPDLDFEDTIDGQLQNTNFFVCEGAAHFIKEVSRMKTFAEREANGAPEELQEAYAAILEKLTAMAENPFGNIDLSEGFFDPRELFEQLEEVRFELDDLRMQAGEYQARQGLCGELERMQGEIGQFVETGEMEGEKMPAAVRQRAAKFAPQALEVINVGLEACNEGDMETAQEAMFRLDKIGQQVFGSREEADMNGAMFTTDTGNLVRSQLQGITGGELDEELLNKVVEKIQAQFEDKVAALERQVVELTAKLTEIAEVAKVLSEQVAEKVLATAESANALRPEAKNALLEAKNEISTVVQEVATSLENVKIPRAVEQQVTTVVEHALVEPWTRETATEIKEKLDSFATFLGTNPDAAEIKGEVKELEQYMREKKEDDRADQVKECHRPFKDVEADAWYNKEVSALSPCGARVEKPEDAIVRGGPDGKFDGGRQLNGAEAATMMARAFGVKEDKDAPVEARDVPEWMRGTAGGLAAIGVDQLIDPTFNVAAPINRRDTARLMHEVMNEKGIVDPLFKDFNCEKVDREFKDLPCNKENLPVYVLVEEGVFKGNPDGTFAPDRVLNRAEAAAIVNRAEQAARE